MTLFLLLLLAAVVLAFIGVTIESLAYFLAIGIAVAVVALVVGAVTFRRGRRRPTR